MSRRVGPGIIFTFSLVQYLIYLSSPIPSPTPPPPISGIESGTPAIDGGAGSFPSHRRGSPTQTRVRSQSPIRYDDPGHQSEPPISSTFPPAAQQDSTAAAALAASATTMGEWPQAPERRSEATDAGLGRRQRTASRFRRSCRASEGWSAWVLKASWQTFSLSSLVG